MRSRCLRDFVHDVGVEQERELIPLATFQRVDESSRQRLRHDGRVNTSEERAASCVELRRRA